MSEKKQGIDKELIRELANILNDTDLSEIEVEQDDLRIRVSRAALPPRSAPRRPPLRSTGSSARCCSDSCRTCSACCLRSACPQPGQHRVLADGRYGLSVACPGRTSLHRSGCNRQGRPDHPHRRSHEDHEPDPGSQVRQGRGNRRQRRSARGVWRSPAWSSNKGGSAWFRRSS